MSDPNEIDLDRLPALERAFVERIDDDEQRKVVACSLIAHRRADRLAVGNEVPTLRLLRLGSNESVSLTDYVDDRPLVLVFGSFT